MSRWRKVDVELVRAIPSHTFQNEGWQTVMYRCPTFSKEMPNESKDVPANNLDFVIITKINRQVLNTINLKLYLNILTITTYY